MKNFNFLVEKIIEEGRIAHKNKKFVLDFDLIEKHLNNISDENPTKAFYLKIFNYLKNNPNEESFYTPESLKKTIEMSLLNDTSSNVAKSMAKEFMSYLNVRDVFKKVEKTEEPLPEQEESSVFSKIIKDLD